MKKLTARDLLIKLQTLALNNPDVLSDEVEVSVYGSSVTLYITNADLSKDPEDVDDDSALTLVVHAQ